MPRIIRRWLGGAYRRLPAGLRRRLQPLVPQKTPRASAPAAPMLSVVVPVYNVERYLSECVESVLSQSLRSIELILVDDGSTDRSPEMADAYAASDARVRVIHQENAGVGAALNTGIRSARGRYLAVLGSDDIIPPDGYKTIVGKLRKTKSDFAIGNVKRFTEDREYSAGWVKETHAVERLAIAIDDYPSAMQNIIAGNRVFLRKFWVERVGGYPEGVSYEDQLPMIRAYLRAHSFDILHDVTYMWRSRSDNSSLSQQKHDIRNLRDQVRAHSDALELMDAEASPVVREAWLRRVLDVDVQGFIGRAQFADTLYRSEVSAWVSRFCDLASAGVWSSINVAPRVNALLVARGLWADRDAAQEYFVRATARPATRVRDGRVYADLSDFGQLPAELPEGFLELSEGRSDVAACVERVTWAADGRSVTVSGWAFINSVDLSERAPETEMWFENTDTGERIELDIRSSNEPEATRWSAYANHVYDDSGFAFTLPLARFAEVSSALEGATWQLRARIRVDGVVREGGVLNLQRNGSAAALRAAPLATDSAVWYVSTQFDKRWGFHIVCRSGRVQAEELTFDAPARTVGGSIVSREPGLGELLTVSAEFPEGRRTAALVALGDDRYGFSLEVPKGDSSDLVPLEVHNAAGRKAKVRWPLAVDAVDRIGERAGHEYFFVRTPRGYVSLRTPEPRVEVVALRADDRWLHASVRLRGGYRADVMSRLVLSGPRTRLRPGAVDASGTGEYSVSFPLEADMWGQGLRAVRSGVYRIVLEELDGQETPARAAGELLAELPIRTVTAGHRTTFRRRAGNELLIDVVAPFTDRELGRSAQRRLQNTYWLAEPAPEDAVVFQSYRGKFATDSQLAIFDELNRRGTGMTFYWGVSDHSVRVPDGATAVIIASERWYEVLASARYLCSNFDFDPHFRKKPHQKFLQTFHGHPFKAMGIEVWRNAGLSEYKIGVELARRNAAWDAIVVPNEECVAMYRKHWGYEGPILNTGYPRDDALVGADAAETRERTLRSLGVPPEKKVVLYAPTWRESHAVGAYSADMFDGLDVGRFLEGVGDDFVVLVRGHNYNFSRDTTLNGLGSKAIDVTDYPEINDLILAADVAVLDYSSVRFDFAITGKPMVFYVPDHERYFESWEPLFDFRSSAPGPLTLDVDELVAAVKAAAGGSTDYAPEIAEFNQRFNALHDGSAAARVVDAFFGTGAAPADTTTGTGAWLPEETETNR